jgi:hypothetical protein
MVRRILILSNPKKYQIRSKLAYSMLTDNIDLSERWVLYLGLREKVK